MANELDELINRVNKMGYKEQKIKKVAIEKSAQLIKNAMKKNAPRSNLSKKHMADNINVSGIESNNGVDTVEITPGSEFDYWKFLEFGTSKIPAQHWAQKSVLESKRNVKNIVLDEIKKGLE
jgi:HK97 gp10 family phage protein